MDIELHEVTVRVAHAADERAHRDLLSDVTLRLGERRIGVVGANGSGKSTLLRLLNGLVLPTRGRVMLDGLDTATSGAAVRRRVGFCFSDPDAQIVMPTVAEDVAFSMRRRKLGAAATADRVRAALQLVGLDGREDHPAHLLSSGQKQLLAYAAVTVTDPDLLVLDEPTTLLDLRHTRRFAAQVEHFPGQVVMATHDLSLLASFDRVLVVDQGRIVADAAPAQAVANYLQLVAAG